MEDDRWRVLLDSITMASGNEKLSLFMACHGRYPALGDRRPPWSFRGWLLAIIISMDLEPQCVPAREKVPAMVMPGRWGYWYRTRVEGKASSIPPEMIFTRGSSAAQRNVESCVQIIGEEAGYGMGVGRLIEWLAWGLAVTNEQPRLKDLTQEKLYKTLCVDLWFADPSDYLGWAICEHKGRGKDPTAFFPTPHELVTLMSRMTFGTPTVEGLSRKVNDPCVGTGRFLLAASNYSLELSGNDINTSCVLATLVNGAIYAPWLSFPFRMTPGVQHEENGQALLFPEKSQ